MSHKKKVNKRTLRRSLNKEYPNSVFVYGSLMQGFHNYKPYLEGQYYIGQANTVDHYVMLDLENFPGLAAFNTRTAYSLPVKGELYNVSNDCLEALDFLEGNGKFYTRELIHINSRLGTPTKAWCYLMRPKDPPPYSNVNVCHPLESGVYCWRHQNFLKHKIEIYLKTKGNENKNDKPNEQSEQT